MSQSKVSWKAELVECIHFLHQQGWAPATSSNYSFKIPQESTIMISSSGKDKGAFRIEDLMEVDLLGQPVNDTRKPSAETLLHTLIYQRCPEVTCILHTHSVYNTVLSQVYQGEGSLRLTGFEVLKGISGIKTHESSVDLPIFANSQDMQHLSEDIALYWDKHPALSGFLLAGHGLYTWGKSIAEAKRHIEVFEFLFDCIYKIKTFGQVADRTPSLSGNFQKQ
ncbi:MAG: methylthioribulose 1-phosphate dehydratase [Saprospiraceae bacterium]|nr:methylthioribulose 1-phosphate dehydratase [Saprospiraceae bacterium]